MLLTAEMLYENKIDLSFVFFLPKYNDSLNYCVFNIVHIYHLL